MTTPVRASGPGALLRGTAAALLLVVNTLVWCGVLFALALVKLVLPRAGGARRRLDRQLNAVAGAWIDGNARWMRWTQRTAWDVQGTDDLRRDAWYLVGCNHQSWVDILVLQRVLNRRIPLLKFFLKRELLYVPVMGLAWWALDFPFMRRHARDALRKNPALRDQDQATARAACAKFVHVPTSVMNFVEGTRFTRAKHAAQGSPYRHLLKPRAGALATTLDAMGPRFDSMLDATIVYPGGVPTFWQFLCGRVPRIVVRCRQRPVPSELLRAEAAGAAMTPAFRAAVARWIEGVWRDKDAEIDALLGAHAPRAADADAANRAAAANA